MTFLREIDFCASGERSTTFGVMAGEGVVVVSRDESKREKPLWSTVLLRIDAATAREIAASLQEAADAIDPRPAAARATHTSLGERSCEDDLRAQCPTDSGVWRRIRRHERRADIEVEALGGDPEESGAWTRQTDRARSAGG